MKGKEIYNSTVSITFSINKTQTIVENIDKTHALQIFIQKALEQTGNTGRPIDDWLVTYNDLNIDANKKVEEYKFPENAVVFLRLKCGPSWPENPQYKIFSLRQKQKLKH
ncbi:MAG: DUF2604 domain-containing protein [Bacteroidetes bacterium]|nr:DUF2604 domain-containing protein [Bacteroidota bacterium]HET6243540.1 DUF2604 domain-containing protein [Bacteroidia bacterium]